MMFVPCIDPGHGGPDTGAAHSGLVEKHLNLELAKRLNASFAGTKIIPVMTRTADVDPSWAVRYNIAKQAGASFILSIHHNANPSPVVAGGEAYYLPSQDLSASVGTTFLHALPPQLRRGKLFAASDSEPWLGRARTVIMAYNEIPCLLIECGYLTNVSDAAYLQSPWAIDAIVSAARCALVRAASLIGANQ